MNYILPRAEVEERAGEVVDGEGFHGVVEVVEAQVLRGRSVPVHRQPGRGDGQGVATITDDDAPPSLSIGPVALAEGTGGTTAFVFTVWNSGV